MKTIKHLIKKTIVEVALLFSMVLIVSCSEDSITDPIPPLTFDPDVALELETLTSFDPFAMQLPESIILDASGDIYTSMSPIREVWKLSPDGASKEVIASFSIEPGLLGISGLRFDANGNLYVAVSSTLEEMNGIWKIYPNQEKERIPGSGRVLIPNDIAFAPDGTLYITDASMGAVWRYTGEGDTELWIQDESLEGTGAFGVGFPIGANGIAIANDGRLLLGKKSLTNAKSYKSNKDDVLGGVIVANSEKGHLVYIPIMSDKSAGSAIILVSNPEILFGLDGITMDQEGAVYGAVNFGHRIIRLSSDGKHLSELASGPPLDFPTSLAFGSGSEAHTLFISNFGVIHFLSDPPMPEEASPGVIRVALSYK